MLRLRTHCQHAKVRIIVNTVLKNTPPTAAPPLKTLLPSPTATARASTLPGQGCALNERHRQAEQLLPMQQGPAYTKFQLSRPLTLSAPHPPPPPPPPCQPHTSQSWPTPTQAVALVRNLAPINGKRARANSNTQAQSNHKKSCAPSSSSSSTSLLLDSTFSTS